MEQEDDAAEFLGVTLGCDEANGLMEMRQLGIIDCVIKSLGLHDGMVKSKFTPYGSKPLVKDAYGSAPCGTFSYSSVVGLLLYISSHTRPKIAYVVNFCARYMFCPKHWHGTALKRISSYLKETRDRRFILNPCLQVVLLS